MRKLFIAVCLLLTIQATAQVEKARVVSISRHNLEGYGVITVRFKVLIPEPLGSSAQCKRILMTYADKYNITGVDVDSATGNRYAVILQSESFSLPKTKNQMRNAILNRLADLQTKMSNLVSSLEPFDTLIGESYIDNTWQLSPTIDSL